MLVVVAAVLHLLGQLREVEALAVVVMPEHLVQGLGYQELQTLVVVVVVLMITLHRLCLAAMAAPAS
jgi:hypothetical protein